MHDLTNGRRNGRTATSGGASNIGGRGENQDRWHTANGRHGREVAVICDGLGGEREGATAARIASDSFLENWTPLIGTLPASERLLHALRAANLSLDDHIVNEPRLHGMATTLVAVEVGGPRPAYISAGDSPLWLWSAAGESLRQVNNRHNPPERPHTLTSCLTEAPVPLIDDGTIEDAETGDLLIVASDGLDTLDREGLKAELLKSTSETPGAIAERLVAAVVAKKKKSQDNVTVIVVKVR